MAYPNIICKNYPSSMRKLLDCLCISTSFLSAVYSNAQCGAGYIQATLNWDNLNYYYNGGSASAPYGYGTGTYVTNVMEQTQKFAIGANYVTIVTSAAGIAKGENGTHTGNVAANYSGDDAQFTPSSNGQTITLTFNTAVQNLRFTLYDVDASQQIDFTAKDASNTAQNINVLTYGASILTVNNNNAANANIKASNSSLGNNVNTGTATITVSGSVKTFTLTITTAGSDPTFWLSDINACISETFPLNYHQFSSTTNGVADNRPFIGPTQNQADYFLVTPDNQWVYYVDAVTGNTFGLFTDATKTYVNSLAYDPLHHILYYVTDGSSSSTAKNNKSLKKYDLATGVSSIVISDITTTLNIPTMDQGVESAGAAFYNGDLYLGIEGGQYSNTATRKTNVYRIDFDASLNPTGAVQVFATDAYSGSTSVHDWGDFIIKDGVLYDFNTARTGSFPYTYPNSSVIHYNMMTGDTTRYINPTPSAVYTGQVGMNWAGDIYSFTASGVQKYNMNGTFGLNKSMTVVSGVAWPGGAGDASDPFRPRCDFGDAPINYDPNPVSPAVHQRSENIRLGNTWDDEIVKKGINGTADTDDGLAYVTTFNPDVKAYLTQVSVYNNSGSNATICAWLDFNGNGLFDLSEGISATVPSSALPQLVWLYWPSTPSSLSMGTFTYLRIRITSASAGMTTSMPTGFFYNGEVEDYRVPVNTYPLAIQYSDFNAQLTKGRKARLTWSVADESAISYYNVEKSSNSIDWTPLDPIGAKMRSGAVKYETIDANVAEGITYYRLKTIQKSGRVTISTVRPVNNKTNSPSILITPNPAKTKAVAYVNSEFAEKAILEVISSLGVVVYTQNVNINAGTNALDLPVSKLVSGTYSVNVIIGKESVHQFLIVNK